MSTTICLFFIHNSAFCANKIACMLLFENKTSFGQKTLIEQINRSKLGLVLKRISMPKHSSIAKRVEVFQKAMILDAQGVLHENQSIELQYKSFIDKSITDHAVIEAVSNGSLEPSVLTRAAEIIKEQESKSISFAKLGVDSGKKCKLPLLKLKASNEKFEIFTQALRDKKMVEFMSGFLIIKIMILLQQLHPLKLCYMIMMLLH